MESSCYVPRCWMQDTVAVNFSPALLRSSAVAYTSWQLQRSIRSITGGHLPAIGARDVHVDRRSVANITPTSPPPWKINLITITLCGYGLFAHRTDAALSSKASDGSTLGPWGTPHILPSLPSPNFFRVI